MVSGADAQSVDGREPVRWFLGGASVVLALALAGCAAPRGGEPPSDNRVEAAEPHVAVSADQPAPVPPAYDSPGTGTIHDDAPPASSDDDAIVLSPLDNFHTIAEGRAYRSAQLSPDKLTYVCRTYGIATVVNLRGPNPRHSWYQQQRDACERAGVELVDIAWSANHLPPRDKLLAFYDAITTCRGPFLFHCSAGADRSGAAAAVYRMVVLGHDRRSAATELSMRYGHFRVATPRMDELVEMFEPRREWIESEYQPPE